MKLSKSQAKMLKDGLIGQVVINRGVKEGKLYITSYNEKIVVETAGYSPQEIEFEDHDEVNNYFGLK